MAGVFLGSRRAAGYHAVTFQCVQPVHAVRVDNMRSHRLTKLVCGVLAVLMIGGVSIVPVGHAADEKAKEKKERAEMRGPLPTFYRDVIDGIQRVFLFLVFVLFVSLF